MWVVLKGLGEGSWDAAPLSGSRGLSSGWAHQSSLGKVSSRISEIMELGIGKMGHNAGTAFRVQPKQRGKREELGGTENSSVPYPCRRHTARSADRVHTLLHLAALISLSQPRFRAGRGAQLLSLDVFRTGTCCVESEIPGVVEGRLGFGTESGRVWLPKVWLRNWLSH